MVEGDWSEWLAQQYAGLTGAPWSPGIAISDVVWAYQHGIPVDWRWQALVTDPLVDLGYRTVHVAGFTPAESAEELREALMMGNLPFRGDWSFGETIIGDVPTDPSDPLFGIVGHGNGAAQGTGEEGAPIAGTGQTEEPLPDIPPLRTRFGTMVLNSWRNKVGGGRWYRFVFRPGGRVYRTLWTPGGGWSKPFPEYKPLVLGRTLTPRKARRVVTKVDRYLKTADKVRSVLRKAAGKSLARSYAKGGK